VLFDGRRALDTHIDRGIDELGFGVVNPIDFLPG
jgi:hypothetical protein